MQVQANDIIFLVIAITIITLIVATFLFSYVLVYNKKKRLHLLEKEALQAKFAQQLLQSQIETQENTLTTLGRELHDNVAQLLSSTKMYIGFAERSLEKPPNALQAANETLAKAIDELRSLSKTLSKDWLQQFNLIENLHAEVDRIKASKTINCTVNCSCTINLNANEQIILYRVLQEAIQNAIKHAQANSIVIKINQHRQSLDIQIEDDGKGFDKENFKTGLGTTNMKNRIFSLNGKIEWVNKIPNGTVIVISLPLTNIENLQP